MVTWVKTFFQGHIARKMMVAVILFSSLITLLITGVQLWVDYRSGLAEIDATLLQIEKTHVPSLAVNVWTMNGRQIETKINGMSKLQDIELLEIINDNDKVEWAQGTVTSTYFRETQYPLLFTSRGATDNLGTLRIITSLDNLYYRLLEKTFFILGSNAVKTFIVAGFILFLFQRLVARHLVALSRYTRRLKLDAPIEDFQLNRLQDKHNPDELDQVVYSLNTMQLKLQDSYRQLATINKELEATVAQRTRSLKIAKEEAERLVIDLKEHQDQLVQFKKMESLGSLTAGIAHNVNNYLHPIRMYGGILVKKFSDKSDERAAMEIILASCDNATDLVKRLMAYSRQEEGIKSAQSIGSVIDETLSLIIPTIPATAKVHRDLDEDIGDVMLNRGQIQSAVMNLISNAVDALDESTGDVTISLTRKKVNRDPGYRTQNFASITVTDTGAGMDDETREQMFDPFFTTKAIGKGTGLGLSTVYGTVTDHRGTINCTSTLGKGTTFEILLPLNEDKQMTVEEQLYDIAKEG